MIKMNEFFKDKTGGNIRAEFVLNERSEPEVSRVGGLNHYKIRLKFESDNSEVEKVVYRLDPTYYDPIRESRKKEKDFELTTTTYGDYPLLIDVQVRDEMVRQEANLLDLLRETYSGSGSPPIRKALQDIEEN